MKTLAISLCLLITPSIYAQTPDSVQGVGYVEPINDVLKLNFKHRGIISACLVSIGQKVKKGELLMQQDDSEEQAALAIEQANELVAQAELKQVLAGINPAQIKARQAEVLAKKADNDYAQLNAQRMSNLLATQAIAKANNDIAQSAAKAAAANVNAAVADVEYLRDYVRATDKDVAQAKLMLARAKVQKEQARLAQTQLRAPSDGVVLEILSHNGDVSDEMNTQVALLFADTSQLRVRAEIDENYALLLKENQAVTLFGRGLGDKKLTATINSVKAVMGKKTVFTKAATERKDVDIRQVFINLPAGIELPIGLETDVAITIQ
jgi:multidrug resistance efflux pump